MTRRSELPNMREKIPVMNVHKPPNMREKIPVMNVHKPPSIEVPPIIVDCPTSSTNSSLPRRGGIKTLRDEKFPPEIVGLVSEDTMFILKMYESSNWTYN